MVNSLLTAIVRADGDALVMHVGERPYVVASAGPVELSSRPLTLEAVAGMLAQLLPEDTRRALDELGAIEHELPKSAAGHGDRFTVVAARGGDDIWIEVRRHRQLRMAPRPAPQPAVVSEPVVTGEAAVAASPSAQPVAQPTSLAVPPPTLASVVAEVPAPEAVVPPAVEATVPDAVQPLETVVTEAPAVQTEAPTVQTETPAVRTEACRLAAVETVGRQEQVAHTFASEKAPIEVHGPTEASRLEAVAVASAPPAAVNEAVVPEVPPAPPIVAVPLRPDLPSVRPLVAAPIVERSLDDALAFEPPAPPKASPSSGTTAPRTLPPAAEPGPAVVLPLARNPIRMDPQSRSLSSLSSPRIAGIDRLLRLAAARGANTLYLMSQARPSVRVDGEIAVLEGESALSAHEVESLLLDLAPERSREALEAGEGTEWMSEVPEVGRIRCQSFRDHRGPGGIFRMISARPTTAEQLGLAREIQALCAEPEGLVLVAGPRASGKSTLVSALVDVINRTRNDYVITVESQISFAHESRGCLVSQREVRGGNDDVAAVVRAALRENPDVLVIEDMRSPEVVRLALEAMEGGHLVIGAISAHGAATAIGRILDQFPEERRTQMQLALAEGLRGVVSQVLLRKTGGGRVAAREVLLNMPSIANLIAEGRVSQLPLAIDSGRKHGMVPLNDALAAFVQNGVVDVKEAYRKAFERQAFLAVLRREGVDTSFVERLA